MEIMPLGALLGLILYAAVTSVTPGPNNIMVMTSGLNFGFTRSVPNILGISLGFGLMVLIVGTGLGRLFTAYPVIHDALRWIGAGYLLYLAWKIATSGPVEGKDSTARRPISFLGAAAFQWANPKAWIMALGALATYLPPEPDLTAVVLLASVFALVNAPCVGLWALFGVSLRRILTKPASVRLFNGGMALLLTLSLYPILFP